MPDLPRPRETYETPSGRIRFRVREVWSHAVVIEKHRTFGRMTTEEVPIRIWLAEAEALKLRRVA